MGVNVATLPYPTTPVLTVGRGRSTFTGGLDGGRNAQPGADVDHESSSAVPVSDEVWNHFDELASTGVVH